MISALHHVFKVQVTSKETPGSTQNSGDETKATRSLSEIHGRIVYTRVTVIARKSRPINTEGSGWATLNSPNLELLKQRCHAGSMSRRSTVKTTARPKRPNDVNQLAHQLIREQTEPSVTAGEISRVLSALER